MQTRFQFLSSLFVFPFALFRPAKPKLKWTKRPYHELPAHTTEQYVCERDDVFLTVFRCSLDLHEMWEVRVTIASPRRRFAQVRIDERDLSAAMARAEQIYNEIIPMLQREIA